MTWQSFLTDLRGSFEINLNVIQDTQGLLRKMSHGVVQRIFHFGKNRAGIS